MKKKVMIFVYYTGVILGICIINYMIRNQTGYIDVLMEEIDSIHRISNINSRELFLYLLLKRGKQFILWAMFFIHLSKRGTLYLYTIYFSIVEGVIFSLCTYYYGIKGIIAAVILILPQCFYYIFCIILGLYITENIERYEKINYAKIIVLVIVVTIVLTILELTVNYGLGKRFFVHK